MCINVIEKDFEYYKILKDSFTSDLFLFTCFQFEKDEDLNTLYLEGKINPSEVNRTFLLSKTVLDQFQQEVYSGPSQYVSVSALVLDVDLQELNDNEVVDEILAEILFTGSIHGSTNFQGSSETALRLAKSFCEQIFDDDYKDRNNYCLRTFSPWNTWFMAGPYTFSETLILVAKRKKTIWLLAYSTSD